MKTKNGREQTPQMRIQHFFFEAWKADGGRVLISGLQEASVQRVLRRMLSGELLALQTREARDLKAPVWQRAETASDAQQMRDRLKICEIKSPSSPSTPKYRILESKSLHPSRLVACTQSTLNGNVSETGGQEAQQRLA